MFLRFSIHKKYPNSFSRRACTQGIFAGRATETGTKIFVSQSELFLHHEFTNSGLCINPIIHGPPIISDKGSKSSVDNLLLQAVLHNRSNCMYVYNFTKSGVWHISSMHSLFGGRIPREHLVTVAGLGRICPVSEMLNRLKHACDSSCLENIDIVVLECDDDSMARNKSDLEKCVVALEDLVMNNKIHAYGLSIDVAPYNRHTPAKSLTSSSMILPLLLESQINEDMPSLDLILYPISPTTAIPATYPMLDEEEEDEEEEKQLSASDASSDFSEANRLFTRGAVNPLMCYAGASPDAVAAAAAVEEEQEDEIIEKEEKKGDVDSDTAMETETELDEANGGDEGNSSEIPRTGLVDGDEDDRSSGLPLVSGLLPPELEECLRETLDSVCPPLKSSVTLQEKALRVVMSVGVEVVVVDAETSVAMGKLRLRPEDMLPHTATDGVFGAFMVPRELFIDHDL